MPSRPGPQVSDDPVACYGARAAYWRQRRAQAAARDAAVARLRLGLFAAAAGLAWAAAARGWPAWPAWALAASFVAAAVAHARIAANAADAAVRLQHYEVALQRAVAAAGGGAAGHSTGAAGSSTGATFMAPHDHPYAADLDLFAAGGLFARLATGQTAVGHRVLADWLLVPAAAATVRARQAQVRALRMHLDVREDLAALGARLRGGLHPEALAAWGGRHVGPVAPLPLLLTCHALLAAGLLASWCTASPLWALLAAALQQGVHAVLRRRSAAVLAAAEAPARELELLVAVAATVASDFAGSGAEAAVAAIGATRIGPLRAAAAPLLGNQIAAPLAWLVLWPHHAARRIAAWHARHGAVLPAWCAALGAAEALLALAAYAYEHPRDPFPEVLEGPPCLRGRGLAHPCLAPDVAVANDLTLDAAQPLFVVSGSNMAGKSTWLRTIGCNVVLALAGAPVRATALALTPWQLGATLRVQDSLQDGTSRFYAEVRRLVALRRLAAAAPPPLLFLLDELFAGTNSHDRAIGAVAVLGALHGDGAMGLVTTHDLALSARAEALGGANVHLADARAGATLRFDYRVRPGVVTQSHALALLRAAGLLDAPA